MERNPEEHRVAVLAEPSIDLRLGAQGRSMRLQLWDTAGQEGPADLDVHLRTCWGGLLRVFGLHRVH